MQGELHSGNFIEQFEQLDHENENKSMKNISENIQSPEYNSHHKNKSLDPKMKHCWMKATSAANHSEEQNTTLEN